MTSFIRNSLTSKPASRNKRLALTLLVSFCLTYMGQAFAMPMICMMPASEMAASSVSTASASSPCHHRMPESSNTTQSTSEVGIMDCCDQMDSDNAAGLPMSVHDCACADGGCGASLTLLISFSSCSLNISEQPHYYSTIGFPSQIDSALFRPPIA
jgi:hypothetical protein